MEKYVAVIAHDAKKADIVELAFQYKDVLKKFPLVGTGETGKRIETATGLAVKKCSRDLWAAISRLAA